MQRVRFGKTGLMVSAVAFGGIPILRLPVEDAVRVVRRSIELGINFIDTANGYADSEEKLGIAIKGIPRDELVITSKSIVRTKREFIEHVDLSLKRMGLEYIDIYQLHHVSSAKGYDAVFGEGGAFEGLQEVIRAGKVRHPAFSSHNVEIAMKIMREGKFSAVQLPFNYVDDLAASQAIPLARELDMGFLSMKPMGGGLLSDAGLSFRYLSQFADIVPDPGIEKVEEIEEIVGIVNKGAEFSAEDAVRVERIKAELGDNWCHRCEYCMPCPENIAISTVLNVRSLFGRMTFERTLSMAGKAMEAARNCNGCRACVELCPYDLDIPRLIEDRLEIWKGYVADNS